MPLMTAKLKASSARIMKQIVKKMNFLGVAYAMPMQYCDAMDVMMIYIAKDATGLLKTYSILFTFKSSNQGLI